MYSILNSIRNRMHSQCPLCLLDARGGRLCVGCLADATADRKGIERCLQCASWLAKHDKSMRCQTCMDNPPIFARAVCAFDYGFPMDMLINGFKEQGKLAYAEMFASMLCRSMKESSGEMFDVDFLIPVPAGVSSLLRRGFNPAGEIARALASLTGIRLSRNWLFRDRHALPQKTMTLAQRRQSVEGLYRCDRRLPPVWVGLVDDVMTTGSTLNACAQALIDAGVQGVVALVVARTPQVWQNDGYVSRHTGSA